MRKRNVIIILITSLLIISNVSAKCLLDDSKILQTGRQHEIENKEQIVLNETNKTNETVEEKPVETITIYCYPSSWRDLDYEYILYKVVWDCRILDICSYNPKNTYEGEWTKISDDTDYSALTGYEKDYHGLDISEYLISIEVV